MKRYITLAALSALALSACKDNTQAQLEQQQKQIEALQQQLAQQNGPAANDDQTVYQLNPDAVASTIPAEFQNGNNGQPVTGTDGQEYVYDQSTGSWLLQSLVGAAAGAFLGNMLANKFTKAPANSATAQQVRSNYYQSSRYQGRTSQQLNTRSVPAQQANKANSPNYRKAQQAQPNYRKPARRSGMRRR